VPITAHLRETVFLRDAQAIWEVSEERIHHNLSFVRFLASLGARKRPLCLVELLDPPASAKCSGRWTLDHVKDHPMLGKRAPDDEWHLVIGCEYHNIWSPPSRALRQAQRAYLADARRAAALQGGGSDEPGMEGRP
jgi:hypothetical protein